MNVHVRGIANRVIEQVLENWPSIRSTVQFRKHDEAGALHCDDGPAMATLHGDEYWYKHGKPHRIGGPATKMANGEEEWYVDGKRHRTNGPAAVGPHGLSYWFVGGRKFTEDEFNLYVDQETGEVFVPPGKKLTYDKK